MARTLAILKALVRATERDLKSLSSVALNNFFLFCFLLLSQSGTFLQALLALLLFFPLSADTMRRIPEERLPLWPLSHRDYLVLRLLSLWLNPVVWLALLLAIAGGIRYRPLAWQILVMAVLSNLLYLGFTRMFERAPRTNPLRDLPRFPGRLGSLVQKNIRELFGLLDPYMALVVAIAGLLYRFLAKQPDPEFRFPLSMLIVIAMSTTAQRLFAFDYPGGWIRYRLLPLRGWQILAAKDAAFLIVTMLLTLPFAPIPALAASLAALAAGHHASARLPDPQHTWRFSTGAGIWHSVVQMVLLYGAGGGVERYSRLYFVPIVILYVASLWFYGRDLDSVRK